MESLGKEWFPVQEIAKKWQVAERRVRMLLYGKTDNRGGAGRKVVAYSLKNEIRAAMRARRKAVTPVAREAAGRALSERLFTVNPKLGAVISKRGLIAVYLASKDEIDLADFISAAQSFGCTLVAPRWNGTEYELVKAPKRAVKIGIAYTFQLVDELPSEPHDIRLTSVVNCDDLADLKPLIVPPEEVEKCHSGDSPIESRGKSL